MLTVALLGAAEVRRDGVLLVVPSGRTTELLVRLAVDAGRRVRADELVEDLWGQPMRPNTLQSKVSQLRRALGDPSAVRSEGDGYVLAVEAKAVDLNRLADLATRATAATRAGDPAAAVVLADEALALIRGEPLVDAGDWAVPHRARLEELHLTLVEPRGAARSALGSGAEMVSEVEALVAAHPLREGLWSSLILALYRAGRQADALAAYGRVRALLDEELGVRPGPGLRALEREVLRQSPGLETGLVGPALAIPGNLPALAASFVGRVRDLATVQSLVATDRLVTLVGPAGVGKTRLALEVARSLTATGGVWLVPLDEAEAGASLTRLVADALALTAGETHLVERLAGADTVLVLDNCEHLLDDAAALAVSLLDAAPRVRILATSQVPLDLDGEVVHRLEPLSSSDSVALFAERARDQVTQRGRDEEAADLIRDVCRALDGLPLAIELAAARTRSLSVRDIARRLDDRFALLRDPSSRRPERRKALAGAIGWSYDLLFPDDQRALWALSCFAGSASLAAVEHVLEALSVPATSVLDSVDRLVDRSLVGGVVGEDGSVRYRLLDSIRAYAGARLEAAGLSAVARSAHAHWYAESAEACDRVVRGPRQPECLTLVRAERANIDAALAWAAAHDPALGTRMAIGFGWTWVVLGDGVVGAARVRSALSSAAPDREQAVGLMLAGWLEASAGDVLVAQADLDAAEELAVRVGDEVLVADVRRHRAFVRIQQGRPHDVLADAAAGLAVYRPLGMPWQTAGSLLVAAYGSIMLGDTTTATRDAEEALALLTPLRDSWGLVHAQAMLGAVAQAEHRFADAVAALAAAAAESEHLGFLGQAALHLTSLARVEQRSGDLGAATATLDRAIAAATSGGDLRLAATARIHLARVLRATGPHEAAVAILRETQEWYVSAGGGEGALLAAVLLAAESQDRSALEEVLAQAIATGNDEVHLYAVDALALEAATGGDRALAMSLLAEADALAPLVAHVVDAEDRVDASRARPLLS